MLSSANETAPRSRAQPPPSQRAVRTATVATLLSAYLPLISPFGCRLSKVLASLTGANAGILLHPACKDALALNRVALPGLSRPQADSHATVARARPHHRRTVLIVLGACLAQAR
eukprot:8484327-Pyramimonas_sp.AAC.2